MNNKWLLLILWFILTAFNLNKAFHIDDTFHLEVAKWIAANPWKPMSGIVNWYDNPASISTFNQPPLYFYWIALVGEIFGYSEVSLHIFQSLFTFLALYFFYKICTIISPSKVGISLFFFAFCPALMINQNLMTDIPLLSLELAFLFFLIKINYRRKVINYTLAALALGTALLIKYSILPLLGVLIVTALYERKYKYLFLGLIPVIMLGLWSVTNLFEFQKIHILNRPINHFSLVDFAKQIISFIACIGAVSPFSIAIYNGKFPYKIIEKASIITLIIFVLFCLLTYFEVIPENISSAVLNLSFFINGTALLTILGIEVITKFRENNTWKFPDKGDFVLITTFIFLTAFIVKYAPFISTRHILLLIPSILLICRGLIDKISQKIKILSLVSSGVLGILLSISDWEYADFYRQISKQISLPKGSNIWVAGHWGWQWYAKNIADGNIQQYSTDSSKVQKGDYIIQPAIATRQLLHKQVVLKEVKRLWLKPGFPTFFSGNHSASMYYSTPNKGPWNLCKHPVDSIIVSRVITGNP